MQGPEESRLKIAAARARGDEQIPGVAEPNSSDEGDIPQLDVRVDRQEAWGAGLGINAIGTTLQPLFSGTRATRWEDPQGYQHDVIVVYPDSLRTSAADVANIPIASTNIDPTTGQPAMVPLSQVAEVRSGVGPQQIERRQLEQQINISAGVIPGLPMGDVAHGVKTAIDSLGLPPGYHVVFSGDVQNLDETKGYVAEALILAVVFIYLILASLFGSFLQPLAIMLALPLSFIGVALALLITRGNINVMSMIGIIMLMGLVTKNGILLVDFTNQQREHGGEREAAILTRGAHSPPPDHHDDGRDDLRHDPARAGDRRRCRAARADGARRDRRPDHVDDPHAVRRAGDVHAARRRRGVGARADVAHPHRAAPAPNRQSPTLHSATERQRARHRCVARRLTPRPCDCTRVT